MDPKIVGAVIAAPAAPMVSDAPASTTSSAAALPAFSAKTAAGPSSGASKGSSLLLERRSLKRIEALLATDPAAALAALEVHKKAFPREDLRAERQGIEERAASRAGLRLLRVLFLLGALPAALLLRRRAVLLELLLVAAK
jgi:hypothetical protein